MNIDDVCKKLYDKHVAKVLAEQTFWIGENAEIEVIVSFYEYNGKYKLSAKLRGKEEIETITYNGSSDNIEVLTAMEKLVNDNEEYILDMVSLNGK